MKQFARGVRGGILTTVTPSAVKTSSNPAWYLEPAEEQGAASRARARWCGMGIPGESCAQLVVKFAVLFPHLDERQRRLLMGAEARILGHGGVRVVARAAGTSETTVRQGVDELEAGEAPLGRVRRRGGGRKKAADVDPGLRPALLALVEPDMRGDPMSALRWTVKSTRTLTNSAGKGIECA